MVVGAGGVVAGVLRRRRVAGGVGLDGASGRNEAVVGDGPEGAVERASLVQVADGVACAGEGGGGDPARSGCVLIQSWFAAALVLHRMVAGRSS